MKYRQLFDTHVVPEWRNKYLDYQDLDAALNRAIESKNLKTRDKGVDLYFELIKFNQKFANFFSRECLEQLNKINTFHKDQLNEVRGKFNNLQDQLDQVLGSAIYREIQPNYSSANNLNDQCQQQQQQQESSTTYNTVTSISELFKNIKTTMGMRPTDDNNQTISFDQSASPMRPKVLRNFSSRFSVSSILGNDCVGPSPSQNLRRCLGKEKVSHMVRKMSEGFANSTSRMTSNIRAHVGRGGPSNNNINYHQQIGINLTNGERASSNHTINKQLKFNGSMFDQTQYSSFRSANRETGSSSQSKKRIIASYKKKMSNLKFAFRELYFNLVLFEQYTQINYNGFEQILRKHDRMFASTLGRKFYQEHIQTADFYNDLQEIDHLIENVEHIYTLHFENGNRRKAIEKLSVPANVYRPSSPMLDFRVGYELGTFAILFALVILVGFISDTGYDWRTVFRLYRSPLLLIIFLFQAGISIVIWKHYKINHVLIFELNPRNNLSFQHFIEFGSILGIIWSVSVLLFLFSRHIGLRPSVCPLVVIVLLASYMFNPTQTGHYQSRFWLLKILGRIFTSPFHPVRFADFWIADQLVSIVPFFLDLEFLSCFYTTGDVLSVSHLSTNFANRCVTRNPQDLVIRTIVAALPAWFRCAQCLRRWRDENWLRLHLANAGKYWCMVMVVVLSSISQYNKSSFELDTMRIIWIVAAVFTSSLTAWWDIIYDFGLFNTYDTDEDNEQQAKCKNNQRLSSSCCSNDSEELYQNKSMRKKNKLYPFLRKELVYPVWVYYFAIVENVILRFGWIISSSLTEFSGIEAGLVVSLLAPLEMFRRFVWNCIRLENEQLNNCGLFRAVRDFPIDVLAPIDESHLDKVIMMMDSRDGPSMRNRLMKRRTLRPDRVSFMVLQKGY